LKNLVLSNLLVLLISSCSLSRFQGVQQTPVTAVGNNDIIPWFRGDKDRYLFQASIDIYNRHFGGIMLIKTFTTSSYRVVYLTELGIKVFDMEFFRNGDFRLYYCIDAINRKSVIRTLKNDFGLMLEDFPGKNKMKSIGKNLDGKTVFTSSDRTGMKNYIIADSTKRVEEILLKKMLLKKMDILFFSGDGHELDSVKIKHFNLKLNIQLSKFYETKSFVPR
jgi:hypothetical protein